MGERDTWQKVAYQNELHLRAERGGDVVQGLRQLTASCSFHSAAAGVDWEAMKGPGNADTLPDGVTKSGHVLGHANSVDMGDSVGGYMADHMGLLHGAQHMPWHASKRDHIDVRGAQNVSSRGMSRGTGYVSGGEFNLPEFVTPPPDMQPTLPLLPLPPMPQLEWPPFVSS